MTITTIKLTQGKVAVIDQSDYALVFNYKWHYRKDKKGGYAVHSTHRPGKNPGAIRMHRLIIGAKVDENVDHINGNKLDNRRKNLRIATKSQNAVNRPKFIKNATSKYKGVHWYRSYVKGKTPHWRAEIRFHRKAIRLGRFETEKEAAIAYNKKAVELFGKFAYLNKI